VPDPTLEKGTTVVEESGSPSSATSVERTVYNADGSVLYDETWNTSYRGEYRVVRVGTKTPAKPKEPPKKDGATPAPGEEAGVTPAP
jgi:uncharacterized protein YabE (DUF348 family)